MSTRNRLQTTIAGLALLLALAASPVRAADWYVATTGSDTTGVGSEVAPYATISAAVTQAAAGDTIHVAAGTYFPTSEIVVDYWKDLTIVGDGAGATIVDGSQHDGTYRGYHSLLKVYWAAVTLQDLTVRNCTSDQGGGALAVWGSPHCPTVVRRCNFAGCRAPAGPGGAIFNQGVLTLEDCDFQDNSSLLGGAVANSAEKGSPTLTATNCRFIGNRAEPAALPYTLYGVGGAIAVEAWNNSPYCGISSMRLTACVFDGNDASAVGGGSAIYYTAGDLTVTGCTFTRGVGGAIFARYNPYRVPGYGFTWIPVTAAVTNCTFAGNRALSGGYADAGAILTYADAASVSNCTFVGNAGAKCGGVYTRFGRTALRNCTFSENTGTDAANAYADRGRVDVGNCILRRRTSEAGGTIGANPFGTYPGPSIVTVASSDVEGWADARAALAAQLASGGDANAEADAAAILVDGGGNIEADPQFVRSPSPGADGVWGTDDDDAGILHVRSGSPCIDAGSNALVPEGVLTDFAGEFRFVDDPQTTDTGLGTAPVVDIGAFEYLPVPAVKEDVQALVTAGVLLPADGQALFAKLDAALDCLDTENRLGAIDSLTAFCNQVRALAKLGKLTQAQADGMLAEAHALITQLGG